MIEHLVHLGQLLLGVWFVWLVLALVQTQKELKRLRRFCEKSRK